MVTWYSGNQKWSLQLHLSHFLFISGFGFLAESPVLLSHFLAQVFTKNAFYIYDTLGDATRSLPLWRFLMNNHILITWISYTVNKLNTVELKFFLNYLIWGPPHSVSQYFWLRVPGNIILQKTFRKTILTYRLLICSLDTCVWLTWFLKLKNYDKLGTEELNTLCTF